MWFSAKSFSSYVLGEDGRVLVVVVVLDQPDEGDQVVLLLQDVDFPVVVLDLRENLAVVVGDQE